MTVRIILLSGPLAVGKTSVADVLNQQLHFKKISSSSFLRTLAQARGLPDSRETLRQLGDLLDDGTGFAWLVDDVASMQVEREPNQLNWFVDAVRKPEQVWRFRAKFPNVLHVHFTAPEDVLRARFTARAREGDEAEAADSYERHVAHPNEQSARSLSKIADIIIDLSMVEPTEAAVLAASHEQTSS